MYVVTKGGHKLPVDTSSLGDYEPFQQSVGLYDDATVLKPVWILELNKPNYFDCSGRGDAYELEFIKELRYDHEPSEEEILWAMSAFGCTRWDIAFVKKAYELDLKYDD